MKLIFLAFFLIFTLHKPLLAQYEYLFQLNQKEDYTAFAAFAKSQLPSSKLSICSKLWNIYLVQIPYPLSQKNIEKLQEKPFIKAWEENAIVTLRATTPNDPFYIQNRMWHHEKMQSPQAWEYTTGGITALGDTIVVAVIDGGCQLDHEDLIDNIWYNKAEIPDNGIDDDDNGYIDDYYAWNIQNSSDSLPIDNHGTSVNGIIGAVGNNNLGIVGVNWNIKIMNLMSHYQNNNIREAEIVKAYEYIAIMRQLYNETNGEKGAFIVATNASFGIDRAQASNYPIWCNIYNELGALGILNMAATNNNRLNVDNVGDMPTGCDSDYLIAVTESNANDELNAAYGKTFIDLAAPSNVYTTRLNNTYATFGGTSGATPQVTGAIALLHAFPNISWASDYKNQPQAQALKLKNIVLDNVDKLNAFKDKTVSSGRLNLGKSMEALYYTYNAPLQTQIIKVFPNPTNTILYIALENAGINNEILKIYDILGREYTHLIKEVSNPYTEVLALNVSDLSAGLYILAWQTDGKTYTIKFEKQ